MSTKLEQLRKMARRITLAEQMEGNLRMFAAMGLDIDDVHTMAESVGLEADDLLLLSTRVSVSPMSHRIVGKRGRRNETKEIADFAAIRRERRLTWNEIYVEWKKQYPADKRVKNPDTIREAYRRYYGDKANKGY
ncbi:MAG: hypothetical protein CMJ84_14610 [Planctomycetes bacterium]|jgi:hypothetical protein|nr:hypothetical protein [Planctomycetota bacterium]